MIPLEEYDQMLSFSSLYFPTLALFLCFRLLTLPKPYYFDTVTSEVSWDPPPPPQNKTSILEKLLNKPDKASAGLVACLSLTIPIQSVINGGDRTVSALLAEVTRIDSKTGLVVHLE